MSSDSDFIDKLKKAFETLDPISMDSPYPKEAMEIGTLVRSKNLDQLGVIINAYYGDVDMTDKKIVIYTILLVPNKSSLYAYKTEKNNKLFIVDEYEYDVIGYLMMDKISKQKINFLLEGGYV